VGRAAAGADHVTMTPAPSIGIPSTIVWATDGSPLSLGGSGFVREVCKRYGSALRIVHVARHLSTQADERRIAQLKALSASMRRHGVVASLHVVRGAIGSPAPHIATVARMMQADLVVLTTRGRAPLTSTTLALIAEAPCPVLVLPAAHAVAFGGEPAVAPLRAASA
jgi:nucleotide-binding universal stress UspA family protein